ncbi:MAG: heme biosynthesis HemY N-terminal domain-containing protein [Paracoccaceae bacterium]
MLNSILKVAIFIAIAAALIFGAHYLLTAPEGDGVLITFRGDEVQVRPIIAVLAIIAAYIAVYLLVRSVGFALGLFSFIVGGDSSFRRYFERGEERRGAEALAQTFQAIEAGDTKRAKQKAKIAESKLKRPELSRLASAKAAELSGDKARAKSYYRALADHSETALVGVKGLLRLAESEGDRETALVLAKTAASLKTDDRETLENLYVLQSHKYDWEGARETLGAMKRANLLTEAETARRESMLALAQAAEKQDAGQEGEAMKQAVDAAKIDPTNVEALEKATAYLVDTGATKQAAKLVHDAWRTEPGPKIAAIHAGLEPDETPDKRRDRFESLFEANPEHAQTRYTRAELALVERKWDEARAELRKLGETEPSARYCAIRAAIARGEGRPESEVRTWLVRGIGAPGSAEGMITDATLMPLLVGSETEPDANTADVPRIEAKPDETPRGEAAEDGAEAAREKAQTSPIPAGREAEPSGAEPKPEGAADAPGTDAEATDAPSEDRKGDGKTSRRASAG